MVSREISQLEEQGPSCSPPILCLNNCGFFGTRENNNLCSSCFKKALMASIRPSPPSSSSLQQSGSPTLCLVKEGPASLCSVTDHPPLPSSTNADPDPTALCSVKEPALPYSTRTEADLILSVSSTCAPPPPQKPNRCFSCRKRVGLTGFKCRCGDVFCSLHRYSDKHNCSFDYKAVARDTIAEENPVVKADKVTKI